MSSTSFQPASFPPSFSPRITNNSGLPDSPAARKLRKAAAEFESMLLTKWWTSMKESALSSDDATDPAKDTLDQMSIQALCSGVAQAGGFGIAAMLVRSLLSNPSLSGAAAASANSPSVSPASTGIYGPADSLEAAP